MRGRRGAVVSLLLTAWLPQTAATAARFQLTGEAPDFVAQAAPRWCWAATAEMVLGFQDPENRADYAQLKIVNATPEGKTCKPDGVEACPPYLPDCAKLGGQVQPNLLCDPAAGSHCFDEPADTKKLKWAEAKKELDECRPFPVLFGDDQGGHWVLAVRAFVGQPKSAGGVPVRFLLVFNPLPCCQGQIYALPFTAYESGINGLPHWKTLRGIVRQPTPRTFPLPCGSAADDAGAQGNLPVVTTDLRRVAEEAARLAFPDEPTSSWRARDGMPQAIPDASRIATWADDDADFDWRPPFVSGLRRATFPIVSPGDHLEAAVVLREYWSDHWAVESIHDEDQARLVFPPETIANPGSWRQLLFPQTGAFLLLHASAPGKLNDPNEPFHTSGIKCRKLEEKPATARAALKGLSQM